MLQRKLWTEEGETKEPGEFVLAGRIQFLCGGKITELKLDASFNLIIKRNTKGPLARCVIKVAILKTKQYRVKKNNRILKVAVVRLDVHLWQRSWKG